MAVLLVRRFSLFSVPFNARTLASAIGWRGWRVMLLGPWSAKRDSAGKVGKFRCLSTM